MEIMSSPSAILAVYNVNLKTRGHMGVMRKVLAQAQGFSLSDKNVHMVCGDGSNIVRLLFNSGIEVQRDVIATGVIPGHFFVYVANWIAAQKQMAHSFKWAYVRYNPMHNDELVQLARQLQETTVPLFIEMYTLEYQNELPAIAKKIDQTFFLQLAPFVTGFFTPSLVREGAKLQGRPLFKMGNGATWIEPQALEPKKDIRNAFYLLGVGYLAHWHGYDRLFPLIPEFIETYPDVDLQIILVGEGPASAQLVQQTQELGIVDYVTFTGALEPQVLANRYASVHLGIGTLGCHRTGISYAEALKHREFMLYGLPFIYSLQDSFSDDNLAGAWKQPPDESPINLVKIYEQYLSMNNIDLSGSLIRYANTHFSWSVNSNKIMQKIQEQLRSS